MRPILKVPVPSSDPDEKKPAILTLYEAEFDDVDLVLKWRMEVLSEVFFPQAARNKHLEEENRSYLHRALLEGNHRALLAEVNGEMVGCAGVCYGMEMPSPDNPDGRTAYLMNVYVRKPYRHQTIARLMVEELVHKARLEGISKIYLETSREARPLYESLGFKDMPDMMVLEPGKKDPLD